MLTTIERVREFLATKSTNTVDEALLERLIASASQFIENWLNRKVLIHTEQVLLDGLGQTELFLPEPNITAIQSISMNGQEIQASDYFLVDGEVILERGCFNRGRRNIKVVYEAGFNTVPADIEQAVIDLVALRYKERDRIGIQSKTLAGETVSYFIGDLSPSAKSILQRYKRVI